MPRRLLSLSLSHVALPLVASALLAAACAEDTKVVPNGAGANATGGGAAGASGAAGTGGTGGTGGSGEGGTGTAGTGAGGGVVIGGGGAGGQSFTECAKESAKAELRPLDIYIVLDRSGSMVGTRWPAVTSALSAFVQAPGATGVGAGIQFFPLPEDAKVCKYEAYAVPAVTIGALPENAAAIDAALAKNEPPKAVPNPTLPTLNTPTLPAMQGAYDFARSWATSHPERTVIVLLATDGEPNGCDSTTEKVVQVAQNALTAATPPITTFVVGVGKELASLDKVAAAGGSEKAILVDAEASDTNAQFKAALEKVRGNAIPCSLPVPKPATGTLDPALVNLKTKNAAGAETFIGRVADAAACGADAVGWYYDNAAAPKEVRLCASSCQAVRATATSLDLVLGCESVVKLVDCIGELDCSSRSPIARRCASLSSRPGAVESKQAAAGDARGGGVTARGGAGARRKSSPRRWARSRPQGR